MRFVGNISEMCVEGPLRYNSTCSEQGGLSHLYKVVPAICVDRVL